MVIRSHSIQIPMFGILIHFQDMLSRRELFFLKRHMGFHCLCTLFIYLEHILIQLFFKFLHKVLSGRKNLMNFIEYFHIVRFIRIIINIDFLIISSSRAQYFSKRFMSLNPRISFNHRISNRFLTHFIRSIININIRKTFLIHIIISLFISLCFTFISRLQFIHILFRDLLWLYLISL